MQLSCILGFRWLLFNYSRYFFQIADASKYNLSDLDNSQFVFFMIIIYTAFQIDTLMYQKNLNLGYLSVTLNKNSMSHEAILNFSFLI